MDFGLFAANNET